MTATEITPIEAAFSLGEYGGEWHARITWKCVLCGRRNSKVMTGPGTLKASLPIEVVCKFGHTTLAVPYRWGQEIAAERG
jgi:hypothetical protein